MINASHCTPLCYGFGREKFHSKKERARKNKVVETEKCQNKKSCKRPIERNFCYT